MKAERFIWILLFSLLGSGCSKQSAPNPADTAIKFKQMKALIKALEDEFQKVLGMIEERKS